MNDIINVINSKDGVIHGKETNENEIKQAEIEFLANKSIEEK